MKKTILPALIIVGVLVIYFIFKPDKAVGPVENLTDEAQNQSNSSLNQGETMNLSFPGVLPNDQILSKKAVIETDKGRIEIELFGDKAPKTVSNFIYLVDNSFYDNLTFHRVEPGFVIQGGDPNGNGTGGPGYSFPDEEVMGDYVEGSVAMANSGPDTNGSQFFICLDNLAELPKKYNLFGQVISGMEVVKSISIGDKIKTILIEPMITS